MHRAAPIPPTPVPTRSFPLALFVVAFVVSISTTCLMLWQSREIGARAEELEALHVDLTEHVGSIMQYDEVLTMSARLCAATGDFAYEKRYDEFDPKLVENIDALRSFVPTVELEQLVASTDEANARLVSIEREAFALTHKDLGRDAILLLASSEYGRLKDLYAAGMQGTTDAAERVIAGEYRSLRQRENVLAIGSAIGVLALIVAWIAAVRAANAWIAMRAQAESDRYMQLEAVGREKDEFLATISHSFKTPLNHILGFAELLKDGRVGHLSTKQQEFVEDIFTAGSGQLSSVDALIELAEVQASKVSLKATSQDPRTVLEAVVRAHQSRLKGAGLTFEFSVANDLDPIPLDTKVVSRIIGILLDNACRFTEAGGKVTLAARRVSRLEVPAWVSADADHYLEVTVEDNGAGIPPDVLRRLFRPFIQGDGRLARTHQGTGISLTLLKKLAELHGGGCAVESEEGTGSRFFIWLPAVAAMAPAGAMHNGSTWQR